MLEVASGHGGEHRLAAVAATDDLARDDRHDDAAEGVTAILIPEPSGVDLDATGGECCSVVVDQFGFRGAASLGDEPGSQEIGEVPDRPAVTGCLPVDRGDRWPARSGRRTAGCRAGSHRGSRPGGRYDRPPSRRVAGPKRIETRRIPASR